MWFHWRGLWVNVLYHYCSTETFVSIVTGRSIRLSSLTLSNDRKEGGLVVDTLLDEARALFKAPSTFGRFEAAVWAAYEFFDGMGFCLSEADDLLSQWRGYADDGRGVAIGFNVDYFAALREKRTREDRRAFPLRKVSYDIAALKSYVTTQLELLKPLLDKGAFRNPEGSLLAPTTEQEVASVESATEAARMQLFMAILSMFEYKHAAFAEEREWRLLGLGMRRYPLEGDIVEYRACGDKIVPYMQLLLEELSIPAISVVRVGPKHNGPLHVVESLLTAGGFEGVEVTRSAATYR